MFLVTIHFGYDATTGACDTMHRYDDRVWGIFPTRERADEVAAERVVVGKAIARREKSLARKKELHSDYQLVSVGSTVSELKPDGNGGFLAK
ncbi:MAG: hypothetical protein WAX80_03595 [Minisyncoccia bacterium]